MKSYHIQCPKCNNDHSFYRYGKDPDGYQKYLCRTCQHQFAPDRPRSEGANCRRKHPPCPVCGKASFLHHDYEHYSNYRCTDKSATIPFLYGNPLPLQLRLCQIFSENTILSVCVIPFKWSSRLCQCFISARILFGISVSYLKLPLILRSLIPLSATDALSLHRCLTICGFSLFPY